MKTETGTTVENLSNESFATVTDSVAIVTF